MTFKTVVILSLIVGRRSPYIVGTKRVQSREIFTSQVKNRLDSTIIQFVQTLCIKTIFNFEKIISIFIFHDQFSISFVSSRFGQKYIYFRCQTVVYFFYFEVKIFLCDVLSLNVKTWFLFLFLKIALLTSKFILDVKTWFSFVILTKKMLYTDVIMTYWRQNRVLIFKFDVKICCFDVLTSK